MKTIAAVVRVKAVGIPKIKRYGYLEHVPFDREVILDPINSRIIPGGTIEDFFSGINIDFKSYGFDANSFSTKKIKVAFFKIIKQGNFSQLVKGFGKDIDSLSITPSHLMQFVREQSDKLQLDHSTSVILKRGKDYRVARLFWHRKKLRMNIRSFSSGYLWRSKFNPQIVLPV